MSENNEKIYKVVLVGEAGVGKTCIMTRFTKDKFDDEYITSFTAQFLRKTLEFADGKRITFDIWDTAGQEKYRALAKVYYKSANAVILVYDITTPESFKVMKEYWYEQVKEVDTDNFIIAIAANKSDLYEERKVLIRKEKNSLKALGQFLHQLLPKMIVVLTAFLIILQEKYWILLLILQRKKGKKKRSLNEGKKRKKVCKKKQMIFCIKMIKWNKHRVLKFRQKLLKKVKKNKKRKNVAEFYV